MTRPRLIARYGKVSVHRVSGLYRVQCRGIRTQSCNSFEFACRLACCWAGLPEVSVPDINAMTPPQLQAFAAQKATLRTLRAVFRVPRADERAMYQWLRKAARHTLAAQIHHLTGDVAAAQKANQVVQATRDRLPKELQW
jgi:hypothetical protein